MIVVKPSVELLWITPDALKTIEHAGRTCYKSRDRITNDSAERFVRMLIKREHYAMIEHASMSYKVICDRGITHEIVRHRLFSFAQESTRYCNYGGKQIEFVEPHGLIDGLTVAIWREACEIAEIKYHDLIYYGCTPEVARDVLPTCVKSEIVITGNFREWRHFFKLRCDRVTHPKMQEIANMILNDAIQRVPVVFELGGQN